MNTIWRTLTLTLSLNEKMYTLANYVDIGYKCADNTNVTERNLPRFKSKYIKFQQRGMAYHISLEFLFINCHNSTPT